MTTCTHTVDCGPLGEVELTVSYKYRPAVKGFGNEPDHAASATIYWIKLGGADGVEVNVADDYINDEIIPACVDDWNAEKESAAESYSDAVRQEMHQHLALKVAALTGKFTSKRKPASMTCRPLVKRWPTLLV